MCYMCFIIIAIAFIEMSSSFALCVHTMNDTMDECVFLMWICTYRTGCVPYIDELYGLCHASSANHSVHLDLLLIFCSMFFIFCSFVRPFVFFLFMFDVRSCSFYLAFTIYIMLLIRLRS